MQGSISGPRVLLRRLREVMAETLEAQERLDKIVHHIAANMVSEVCSVYVLRADGNLELFATEGLKIGAVHNVSLRIGQGLVGTIAATARALNLEEAQKHPAFAYLPETGEEDYSSFLGVPILRAGRAVGVLVVQNKAKRSYREDEIEAMETTAMVLAELIAAGELGVLNRQGNGLDMNRPVTMNGTALADGIGLGKIVLHEPRVVVTNLFNENAESEIVRLGHALGKLRISIDSLLARGEVPKEGEHREVLEAYRMFANDRGWIRRMEEAISNGLTAEAAVEKVQSDNRARMMRQSDPYLRERLHDLDDLAHRLLRELMEKPHGPVDENLDGDFVVVARSMGAAELLDYSGEYLRGLVLEEAAPTSHVVIVAKALGIPVAGQLAEIVSVAELNDEIIVDGNAGIVHIRPLEDIKISYVEKIQLRAEKQKLYENLKDKLPRTKDGLDIDLLINAGLLMDLPQLENVNAAGIGLFRTELQFMIAESFPRPGEQEELYRSVIDAANGKPVTFRTLDVGGDKVLPYLRSIHEENPALGWRAIRLALDRPGLIRTQVKALLKASGGRKLRLMLPMVTEIREIMRAKEIISHEVELLTRFGHEMPTSLELGSMIEVPSLLWQLDELMQTIDFVSVGSNDLFQFVMASDRGNAKIANRFDPMSRPFLRVLRQIADKANEYGRSLTLCGELAGRPLAAMALIALGYRSISMSPASLGPVKAMILKLDSSKLEPKLREAIDSPANDHTISELLRDFAESQGIPY